MDSRSAPSRRATTNASNMIDDLAASRVKPMERTPMTIIARARSGATSLYPGFTDEFRVRLAGGSR